MFVIEDYEKQVRALLGREESELSDGVILLDVYTGRAWRDAEKATGLESAVLEGEKKAVFQRLVVYKAALLLVPHCMAGEATVEQTANARVEREAMDWDALRALFADEIGAALEELLQEDGGNLRREQWFRLAGPGRR